MQYESITYTSKGVLIALAILVYTIKETSAILKVPISQVYALIQSGLMAYFEVDKHYRITEVSLLKYIKDN